MISTRKRTRSLATSSPTPIKKKKTLNDTPRIRKVVSLPENQSALLLHATKQPYESTSTHSTPSIKYDWEILVKVEAIGLNPIDWKAPDFGFGIPVLPYLAGREFAGTVVQLGSAASSRIQLGDLVTVPSTDYRDLRKAAYQEYSIASAFNTIRLPAQIPARSGSILGVAFVAAVLALGICMGIDFQNFEDGPDLLRLLQDIDENKLPKDIRDECLKGIQKSERAQQGDFLVIWGGSSTCAHVAKQLARLAGLKIVSVVDSAKHALRLSSTDYIRPDLVVDSYDPQRAIDIIKASTGDRARFGLDTMGKESAAHLLKSLSVPSSDASAPPAVVNKAESMDAKLPTPPNEPLEPAPRAQRSHLVGLTGLPKTDLPDGVALHSVPIKLFHEVPEVGEALSAWCERLLGKGLLMPPDVVGTVDGLDGINGGLDRMRRREVRGGRLVAVLNGDASAC